MRVRPHDSVQLCCLHFGRSPFYLWPPVCRSRATVCGCSILLSSLLSLKYKGSRWRWMKNSKSQIPPPSSLIQKLTPPPAMATFAFARLLALFCAAVAITRTVVAAPTAELDVRTPTKRNFLASAPHFVTYNDDWVTFPSAATLTGYNVL